MRLFSIVIGCFLALTGLGCGDEESLSRTNLFDPMNSETHGDPFDLTVTITERIGVLTWNEPDSVPFDFYQIYRQVDDNDQVDLMADMPQGMAWYEDMTISGGHQYTYRIRAVREQTAKQPRAESGLSKVTKKTSVYLNALPTVTIQPPEIEGNTATMTWTATDDDGTVKGYRYRLDGGPWSDFALKTRQTFPNLREKEKHTIQVQAQDDAGDEGPIGTREFVFTIE